MGWNIPRLTRRQFLKATAGGTGLTLLSPLNGPQSQAADSDHVKIETSHSVCNFCSSLCNLKVKIENRGGRKRIVKLAGNPESTLNRGKLCARGQSGLRQVYDPDRIKTPLIRVEGSKRGEYTFRSATWEEAWDYIAQKKTNADIKPWEWTMVGGWTSCVFYMNWAIPFAMSNGIPNIIASPMQHCVTTGHLGTDAVTGNFNIHDEILPDFDNARYILFVANNASIGSVSTCRMVRFAQGRKNGAKVVALDPRRSETAAKADEWLAIRPGTDLAFLLAMMRIMMQEGYYDAAFLKRYTNMPFLLYRDDKGEWQPLLDAQGRPKVVAEGTRDVLTLEKFTHDNRDNIEGRAICPELLPPEDLIVDSKAVKSVFQAQLEELEDYTPEWAAVSTGIDAETIRRIAREFGTSRPAIIDPGWHGARFSNMMMLRRVQAMIQALTGGIDTVGGWIQAAEYRHKAHEMFKAYAEGHEIAAPMANLAGMHFAKMVIGAVSNGGNFAHGRPGWTWAWAKQQREAGAQSIALPVMTDTGFRESIEGKVEWNAEPYLTRAVIINAANPVRHYYPDTYWKECLSHENMELVIAVDVLPSDTAAYADVILPNTTYLERDEPMIYGNGVNQDLALTTRYAAIDPLYDCEETPDILYKLTEIVSGNSEGFLDWIETLTGLAKVPLKAAWQETRKHHRKGSFLAACRRVSFDNAAAKIHRSAAELDDVLRKRGVYHEADKTELIAQWGMPRKMPVPTESGRIEFFSSLFHSLRQAGNTAPNFSPLATHIHAECRVGRKMHEPLAEDEFYFSYGKTPTVSHASTNSNNPVLAAINDFKNDIYKSVWIHPQRAAALGIGQGDRIRLTNLKSKQSTEGHAYVTRLIRPDTLFIYSSFGVENPALSQTQGEGTATNKLIPYQVEPVVAGFRSQEFTLRVQKA
jgi:anaerobic selenocysteine-containing dehydrogenase